MPFSDIHTIAKAINTGNPPGGDEILKNAYKHHWLSRRCHGRRNFDGPTYVGANGFFR
ncbi:MAG: hypothetical protein ACRDAI_00570 [Candidatus Rhabdochlamydia sp.]